MTNRSGLKQQAIVCLIAEYVKSLRIKNKFREEQKKLMKELEAAIYKQKSNIKKKTENSVDRIQIKIN